MRILHVIDSLEIGGAENVLVGLAIGQCRNGHDVTILQLVKAKNPTITDKMTSSNIHVTWSREKGSVYSPIHILKILVWLREVDIVHVHLFPALYWGALANWISWRKKPIIYTEHSTMNRRRNNFFFHSLDYYIYQNGYNLIVACSKMVQEKFQQAFPRITHISCINNGIDIRHFRDAAPYSKFELLGVNESSFIVTMVARFMSMKRQDTLIEALPFLSDNVHVVFIGGIEGDDGVRRVSKLAKDKGVIGRTHFLYSRKDVARILKTTDVVVLASDYEGLSLSSLEGMAACKPVIASDVNGLSDTVGGAGILFENNNSRQLADIIRRLAQDKQYYQAVSKRCEIRAKDYDVTEMVKNYCDLYECILNH